MTLWSRARLAWSAEHGWPGGGDQVTLLRERVDALRAQRAGSGLSGTALDSASEPVARLGDEHEQWLSTGQAHQRTGLSTSYLRRLARSGHPAAQLDEDGRYLWRSDHLPARSAA